jgi:4-hydroxy-2-oxoheptanedioate aldolase
MLLPLLESQLALDKLDEILAVPGLRAVFLGMGDLSVILGHPNDYTHPDLTAFIADTVARAAKHDVAVFANIHGRPTMDGIAEGVGDFEGLGVKGIFVPRDSAVLIRFYRDLLDRVRP